MAKRWTELEKADFKAEYGKVDSVELAAKYGLTPDSLRKQASRMGLSQPWPDAGKPYLDGDVCVIPLNSRIHVGKVAYVDADQYEMVGRHTWHVVKSADDRTYYARTNVGGKPVSLHTILLKPPKGLLVDHKDGDGLNNRSNNIRIASYQQNGANKHSDTPDKGVFRYNNRYVARICQEVIGRFDTEVEAAKAYDKAALERWGEFANLNYPS